MFNLEQAIADWRQKMLAAGIAAPVPLEELELHLREQIDQKAQEGVEEKLAFELAVQSIGEAGALKLEFQNAGTMNSSRQQRIYNAVLTAFAFYTTIISWKMLFRKIRQRPWGIIGFIFMGSGGCMNILHGWLQLKDTDFAFATMGGSFSWENFMIGPGTNLLMGSGTLFVGVWLIGKATLAPKISKIK